MQQNVKTSRHQGETRAAFSKKAMLQNLEKCMFGREKIKWISMRVTVTFNLWPLILFCLILVLSWTCKPNFSWKCLRYTYRINFAWNCSLVTKTWAKVFQNRFFCNIDIKLTHVTREILIGLGAALLDDVCIVY